MNKVLFLSFVISLFVFNKLSAQPYPKDYFRSPLNIPLLLAGNFGECRPNHFHSGIDIKTEGKENLPVYAVADGYVSRIKMEPGGYGHGIYITHPNGYTTLYAHLNDLMPELQQYVKAEQYKKQNWELDITPGQSQFPVKKGQQIAWSGNTGASTAPHLHFEIRDTKTEHPLNPQLFGFDIKDDIAPVPTQIAAYDANNSIYEQSPIIVGLKKKGILYAADTLVVAADKAYFGVNVNDFMNGSENTLTFYTATIYFDSVLQGTITLDDIGYDVTRYQHAYIDYKTKKQKGSFMQLLHQLPGNMLNGIYNWKDTGKGVLYLSDRKTHKVEIILEDANTNKSNVVFFSRYGVDTTVEQTANGKLFEANKRNSFETPNVEFILNEKALYDNITFSFGAIKDANSYSDRCKLHYSFVPVHSYHDLRIKPVKAIGFNMRDKMAMVYKDGSNETGKAAIFDNGFYKASVRNWGEYRLVSDTEAPVIKALQKNGANFAKAKRISFTAKDAITSVKKFRGELDGKWICVEQHGDVFFYTFDEYCPKGKHNLVFTASDENGNKRSLNFTFVR